MLKTLIVAAAIAAAVPAAPALADHNRPSVTVELGIYSANDRRGYDRDYRRGPNISRREAISIASSYGISRVYDVDLRGGVWEVSGSSWRGGRIEVEISARNGRVIDVDYGRGRGRGRGWDDDGRGDRDWDRDGDDDRGRGRDGRNW